MGKELEPDLSAADTAVTHKQALTGEGPPTTSEKHQEDDPNIAVDAANARVDTEFSPTKLPDLETLQAKSRNSHEKPKSPKREDPKDDENSELPKIPAKKPMTEDATICSTCHVWGHDRPSNGNLCKVCGKYGLCVQCERKNPCCVCRETLSNYDPAKTPRICITSEKATCFRHGKERGMDKLQYNGNATYRCRPECQCKGPRGDKCKGKDTGKDKTKSKKTGTPRGKPSGSSAGRPHEGGQPQDCRKKPKTDKIRSWGPNASNASEDSNGEWPATWETKPPSTNSDTATDHHLCVVHEASVINGKDYQVLSHNLKCTLKNGKPTKISLMDVVNLIADAVAEYDNSDDRPGTPSWITINQLAHWLEKSNKLIEIDVYSVIPKALVFITHYCTPLIHHGLLVVAANPGTYPELGESGGTFDEIFISSITVEWIIGGREATIAERMTETRQQIGTLVQDIVQNYSKLDLEERSIKWIQGRTKFEQIAAVWFESNGFFPNSSYPNPDNAKTKDEIAPTLTPTAKAEPRVQVIQGNPRRYEQNPLAQKKTDQLTQVSQHSCQNINSQTEASDPGVTSPSSVAPSNILVAPLGGWNPRIAPNPVMFGAGIHNQGQIHQLEDYVKQHHGVSLYRDLSRTTRVCLSGHTLSPVQLLEIVESPPSPRGTACSCCSVGLMVNSYAFTYFRCVSYHYLNLPIDKAVASAGLAKGVLYCTNCAFHAARTGGDIQFVPVGVLASP